MPADDSAQGKAGGRSMEAAAPVCGRCIPRVKDTADRHFIQCGTDCSITGIDRPGGQTPYRLYSGGGRTDERTCGRAFVSGPQ